MYLSISRCIHVSKAYHKSATDSSFVIKDKKKKKLFAEVINACEIRVKISNETHITSISCKLITLASGEDRSNEVDIVKIFQKSVTKYATVFHGDVKIKKKKMKNLQEEKEKRRNIKYIIVLLPTINMLNLHVGVLTVHLYI